MTETIISPSKKEMSRERLSRIRPHMTRWIERGTLPGISMMVHRRGQRIYEDHQGVLDRETGTSLGLRFDAIMFK